MSSTRPSDWTDGADLESLLRTLERVVRLGIRTVIPGRVTFYDPLLNMATVEVGTLQVLNADDPIARTKLLAKGAKIKPYGGGRFDAVQIPTTVTVPVMWPGGSGSQLTFPMDPNVKGLLLVCDRNPGAWVRSMGVAQDPQLDLTHAVSDAVFMPRWPMSGPDATPTPTPGAVCLHARVSSPILIGDQAPTGLGLVPAACVGSDVAIGAELAVWLQGVATALAGVGITLPPVPTRAGYVSTGSAQVQITKGLT